MSLKNYFLTGTLTLAAGLTASAQMPNASQQVDSVQQRRQLEQAAQMMIATNAVPELYAGETGDVGPQSVLQLKPRRTYIEAFADAQYFYTDNMFLADQNKQGADVLVSTVSAALAPTPYDFQDGLLAPRLGYQQQWFTYGQGGPQTVNAFNFATHTFSRVNLDQFDFNVMTVFSDLSWSRQNWTFTAGGYYRQLNNAQSTDEFYKEYVPRWAARRDFFTGEKTTLSIGYEGDCRLTETANVPPQNGCNFNNRVDNSLVVAGSWQWCRHAILQPSYRFQQTHFTAATRDDYLNSFALALYIPINDYITLRGYVSYDILKTDGFYVQNSETLNAGGGLNLAVRF
jgi:hypothetical protein